MIGYFNEDTGALLDPDLQWRYQMVNGSHHSDLEEYLDNPHGYHSDERLE